MISVIIPTSNAERELQVLLPVLVPAAVDGLVREVIVADAGSTDATLVICEDAGAEAAADLASAAAMARGDLFLVLPPDLRLRRGWEESLRRHIEGRGGAAWLAEGPPTLVERLTGPRRAGVLLSPEAFRKLAPKDFADLRRRLGRAAWLS
ncbi:cell wall biosynthesis glycosyltransferase [Phenylobacterium sp.]|uniref:cell wall biosynthesis glycosyltransferase n=1 Tax=Phenylobacterium sp. TaxID=1871053 RepID=UPI0028A1E12A|nr:cell wall biosynthesis glycosyltransferase [Phenylobacterium sp.]